MNVEELLRTVRASSVAELVWVRPEGSPDATGVIALPFRGRPAVAFTYAAAGPARAAAAAPLCALALTESRSTGSAFRSLAVLGSPELVEDPTGDVFCDELLAEELRRYPPSRALADSVLLRREHWWYLPRLILTIDPAAVVDLPRRLDPSQLVLAVAPEHERLALGVARPVGASSTEGMAGVKPGDRIRLDLRGAAVPPGPAVLMGQDASFPDLERWAAWRYRGRWDGDTFTVVEAPAGVGLPPPPGVWQRLRREHDLARRCRQALPQ